MPQRHHGSLDSYVPPEPHLQLWATFVPSRFPNQFKVHNTSGQAQQAVNYGHSWQRRGGIVFRLDTSKGKARWVEDRVVPPTGYYADK